MDYAYVAAADKYGHFLWNYYRGKRMAVRTFSIRSLMILIAFLALCTVAIRYAGNFWGAVFSQLTVFSILAAAVCAYLMRGYQFRPFLIGFAIFGSVFFALNYRVVLPEAVHETKTIGMYWPIYMATKQWTSNYLGRSAVVTQVTILVIAFAGGALTQFACAKYNSED